MTIDVIRLAREANIDLEHHVSIGRVPVWIATQDELERFAALVMEEAAKLFDQPHKEYFGDEIQEAIRARKPA